MDEFIPFLLTPHAPIILVLVRAAQDMPWQGGNEVISVWFVVNSAPAWLGRNQQGILGRLEPPAIGRTRSDKTETEAGYHEIRCTKG